MDAESPGAFISAFDPRYQSRYASILWRPATAEAFVSCSPVLRMRRWTSPSAPSHFATCPRALQRTNRRSYHDNTPIDPREMRRLPLWRSLRSVDATSVRCGGLLRDVQTLERGDSAGNVAEARLPSSSHCRRSPIPGHHAQAVNHRPVVLDDKATRLVRTHRRGHTFSTTHAARRCFVHRCDVRGSLNLVIPQHLSPASSLKLDNACRPFHRQLTTNLPSTTSSTIRPDPRRLSVADLRRATPVNASTPMVRNLTIGTKVHTGQPRPDRQRDRIRARPPSS